MKKIFLTITMGVIFSILVSLYNIINIQQIDFTLKPEITSIFWGPSTTGCAINDTLLYGTKNLSRNAIALHQSVPLLELVLKSNPKIDTIYINNGRFMFSYFNDKQILKHLESYQWTNDVPYLYLATCNHIWIKILTNPICWRTYINFNYSKIFNSDLYSTEGIGLGCINTDRNNLFVQGTSWSCQWYDSTYADNVNYDKEWITNNCKLSDIGTKEIIELCRKNNVTPVLFFTPLFEYDRWFSINGFCEYMKSYDPDILIADYEDYKFPDNSYYADVHHLNTKGQRYFTLYLAENGINCIPLKEWITQKEEK